MATKRKPLPRHAEHARLDALALILPTMAGLSNAANYMTQNNHVASLAALVEAQQYLGQIYVILHQQGDGTYNGLANAEPIGNL